MFIKFHLFSVDQCVSLIWHESYTYLMIFCASKSDIKIMKSTNECSSTFIFSVLISVFPWFSMKVLVTWWFFVPAWVTLKLWRGVFSYNFGMENLMVQSVFSEHQCMFINFHLFSIDQYVSLIFHESYSYIMIFCASMSNIGKIYRGQLTHFVMTWSGITISVLRRLWEIKVT